MTFKEHNFLFLHLSFIITSQTPTIFTIVPSCVLHFMGLWLICDANKIQNRQWICKMCCCIQLFCFQFEELGKSKPESYEFVFLVKWFENFPQSIPIRRNCVQYRNSMKRIWTASILPLKNNKLIRATILHIAKTYIWIIINFPNAITDM